MQRILRLFLGCFLAGTLAGQPVAAESRPLTPAPAREDARLVPGAERFALYESQLAGRRVGIFANHTARVDGGHLVDALRARGVDIRVIFGPEHGFRGTANAGEAVAHQVDERTGLPIVSLYGSKRQPSAEDLREVDVLLFDMQDVGVRFYTYISSLEAYMEAAFTHGKPLIVLDRPNPHGFYVDGPVLESRFRSFVGRQPIPVVHGLTVGEYAVMLLEEGWLETPGCDEIPIVVDGRLRRPGAAGLRGTRAGRRLEVITCEGYTHDHRYTLPVAPSPNLPDGTSVSWYPSIAFFEGTALSEGRGTDRPFVLFGHPRLPDTLVSFVPRPNAGARQPKLSGKICYGWDVSGEPIEGRLQLGWLLQAYRLFPDKEAFFLPSATGREEDAFFNKLAGNATLMAQIKAGWTEEAIRASWEPALSEYKVRRKRFLLYPENSGARP